MVRKRRSINGRDTHDERKNRMSRDCYDDWGDDQNEIPEEENELDDLEIPDVPWKEDLEKIPDHDLKLMEIGKAP